MDRPWKNVKNTLAACLPSSPSLWRFTFISSKKLLGGMLTTLDIVISQRPAKENRSDSLLL